MKQTLKNILTFLKLDLTKNLEYDRLTKEIIQKIVKPDSVCVDVGCHKGEILDLFIEKSKQKHYAFEPIPDMNKALKDKYGDSINLFNCALSNEKGETSFNYVKNAPAYSGIKKRAYKVANPDIEKIPISLEKMDDIINSNDKIDVIKIDVEGAELNVLKGAKNTILSNEPIIIFECGLGASEYYETTPNDVFTFFKEVGMKIFLLKKWIKKEEHLQEEEFVDIFNQNKEYYFIASK